MVMVMHPEPFPMHFDSTRFINMISFECMNESVDGWIDGRSMRSIDACVTYLHFSPGYCCCCCCLDSLFGTCHGFADMPGHHHHHHHHLDHHIAIIVISIAFNVTTCNGQLQCICGFSSHPIAILDHLGHPDCHRHHHRYRYDRRLVGRLGTAISAFVCMHINVLVMAQILFPFFKLA